MDVREFTLQEDTGFANGRNMTEVQGPTSHRKPIEVRHYYAGYHVNEEPGITENRIIDKAITRLIPGYKNLEYIAAFCRMLMAKGLLGDFVFRYAKEGHDKSLREFLETTDPVRWLILGIAWGDRVYDYLYLDLEWEGICATIKENNGSDTSANS